jgi:hypothetical protein
LGDASDLRFRTTSIAPAGLAAAADALDFLVERGVFLAHGIVRIYEIFLTRAARF